MAHRSLDDQSKAEGEQKAVEVVEIVNPTQQQAFDNQCEHTDNRRPQEKSRPIAYPVILQKEPCGDCTEHILSAMGEVDDTQKAEDYGQAETEDCIKGPVDDAD